MGDIIALVFDIDDTLYAERDYVFSGYDAVAEAFAARLPAKFDLAARMRELFDSPHRARVFNVILTEAGVPGDEVDTLAAEMVAAYRAHTPKIELLPEARDLLALLPTWVRLGVISDGYLITQQQKAAALGLFNLMDEVIFTDAWGREFWKPHKRAFEEMARRLHVPPAACAYVSDNLAKDFVAANALGWTTVLVDRPERVYATAVAPAGGEPRHVVRVLTELPDLLGLDGEG
ncbi:MAG TPA: HAD family hydrolase [Phycisphaerae bacterium]|nr:HAD family hydrolase [Phycisphaerae bacterium]